MALIALTLCSDVNTQQKTTNFLGLEHAMRRRYSNRLWREREREGYVYYLISLLPAENTKKCNICDRQCKPWTPFSIFHTAYHGADLERRSL